MAAALSRRGAASGEATAGSVSSSVASVSRILWISNPPWLNTGYGVQTAAVVRRLAAAGHDVTVGAITSQSNREATWHGVRVLPHGDLNYGADAVGHWVQAVEPEVVVILHDLWSLAIQFYGPARDHLPQSRWLVWHPVDKEPMQSREMEHFAALDLEAIPMSNFGRRMETEAGLDPHPTIWHGIEPDQWQPPADIAAVDAVRADWKVPADAHLTIMVGMNKESHLTPRKAWPQALWAWARFARHNPDAFLLIWANPDMVGGVNLSHLAEGAGVPEGRLLFPSPRVSYYGASTEALAAVVGAADVHLQPSHSEGFGLPLIEAGGVGVRTIANDSTAQTELIDELNAACDFTAGWLCRRASPVFYPECASWVFLPDTDDIEAHLQASHDERLTLDQRRDLSRHTHRLFDHDTLAVHWHRLLRSDRRPALSTKRSGLVLARGDQSVQPGRGAERPRRRGAQRKRSR